MLFGFSKNRRAEIMPIGNFGYYIKLERSDVHSSGRSDAWASGCRRSDARARTRPDARTFGRLSDLLFSIFPFVAVGAQPGPIRRAGRRRSLPRRTQKLRKTNENKRKSSSYNFENAVIFLKRNMHRSMPHLKSSTRHSTVSWA